MVSATAYKCAWMQSSNSGNAGVVSSIPLRWCIYCRNPVTYSRSLGFRKLPPRTHHNKLDCNLLRASGSHFNKCLRAHKPNLAKHGWSSHLKNDNSIPLHFCIRHDSFVAVTHSKLQPDWIIEIKMTAKMISKRFHLLANLRFAK